MTLSERLERLEPRERQMLNVMFGIFVVLVVVVAPIGLAAMAGARRGENEELREVVDAIESGRAAVRAADAQNAQVLARYKKPAPQLAAFLDGLARQSGIEIPESQDRAPVPHGKQYEERSTKILLRRVGMLSLARFMERIEKSPYPVVISRLNIRKRSTEPDSYDVEMIVSAYDRKGGEKKNAPKSSAKSESDEEEE